MDNSTAMADRPIAARISSSFLDDDELVPQYVPPTEALGRVPQVIPGKSGGDKPIEGDFPLDQVVIDKLPPGTIVHSCTRYGASAWTVTARIETTLADGKEKLFFLKCADDDWGKEMLDSEFTSMKELHKANPNFFPEPYAWGKLNVSNPDTYYFLCQFIEMAVGDPDPVQFCTKLVRLHQNSESPTGQFGFHRKSCQGNLPQGTAPWQPTWTEFYVQMLRHAMDLNKEKNGNWKDLEQCVNRLISHVVPKVIAPLETEGRKVKPCLIHGDLWDQNVGTDFETGEVYAFDASAYFAHNEMEIATWRGKVNTTLGSPIYRNTYLARMGISEPVELFEDRQIVYQTYFLLHHSALHNGSSFRQECYENLKMMIKKWAPETPEDEVKADATANV